MTPQTEELRKPRVISLLTQEVKRRTRTYISVAADVDALSKHQRLEAVLLELVPHLLRRTTRQGQRLSPRKRRQAARPTLPGR
jgi:hypothetical protein